MKYRNNAILYFFLCLLSQTIIFGQVEKDTTTFRIERLPFNTNSSEHSPVTYKNGILFVTNRNNNLSVVYTSEDTDEPLSDIYFSAFENEIWKKPVPFNKLINSELSEGPLSITKDNSKLFFTRNDVKGEKTKLSIYSTSSTKNGWSFPELHPINGDNYSCGHPAIAPSGNFMIFSSNMKGGFGGTDLYITYNKEGKWTKPKNLGKNINTPKNEITPFIVENNILYFASNGHKGGAGGYDVYRAIYSQFDWTDVKNLGYPINTAFNDFGFCINSDLDKGYFSSNRLRGNEDDDIYSFKKSNETILKCDTLKEQTLCRTFFEESTLQSDENSPLIYQWDFGDGNKKKGNEVRYCYSKPGTYTVQLNIVDIISDQIYINEATYQLEIATAPGATFSIADTIMLGKEYTLNASNSILPYYAEKAMRWDMGTGNLIEGEKINYTYENKGEYWIKLLISGFDKQYNKKNECITKKVLVMTKNEYESSKVTQTRAPQQLTATAKTIYSIRDSDGNDYKIQLATSKTSIKHEFKKLEGIIKVEEYYDRDVFGYTTGKFNKIEDAYPTMKKIRKIGFSEAILIATKNGKVISGNDSSFFVNLPEKFVPIRLVVLKGKVINKNGVKLPSTVKWESLTTGDSLGSMDCINPLGEFSITVADGDLYGYSASMDGYFPSSNYLDLRKENDYSEIKSTIILYKPEELANDSTPIKLTNIFFSPEKYDITPESHPELERIASFIQNNKDFSYEIAGHTDHTGSAQYNQVLSEQRALAVRTYLIKLGCEPLKLQAKGYGNTRPATTNRHLLELNRRVEFKVFKNN
ncbi:MAG: PKD domain-containing protein [Bacteroidota bacterium]|nr:PKD domain-containing protein [Bacteroidota bacterium]